ncbi:formimidoylglutamate deiminase [Methylobacterium nonmethylotrophicum]|uniref:Formimidoylglutamate deiminase n=1 Tax=Methylobacterium nonmethylotrophicum TaxID=1141884 RepID=A0A4Z0NZ41_9HYPH|nr:formimidoylglutamate deiminase [Methylobacterium nonmethylotrophicum]TGE02302.1 formimidoylglutamate deiminase [Methylobacterium nonmethylotrophicum]
MTVLHAAQALTPTGWQADVRLTLEAGRFSAVEAGKAPEPGDVRVAVLVPGLPNLHSHAFQRGMAGLAERRGPSADTFWTWRETMYRFALRMTPDEAEAVAAQAYMEMLESGFTRVGEFHYLHHAPDGRPYANVAEMAERIAAAAALTGLRLTLLPVLYRWSNFGGAAPTEGQRRFVSDLDLFARMVDESRAAVRDLPGATLGVAPHSLRAVTPGDLAAAVALAEGGPVHIHAAEQVREVEECLAWSGARPVQWLLDQAGLDPRWCLIHATHMNPDETARFAGSGAVAGLCPVTEASLGDGIFPAPGFVAAGGRYGVGTDSNVLVGAADELRQLEYAQRLGHRQRNVLAAPGASTGRALFTVALAGGIQALGAEGGGLAVGAPADCVALDGADPALIARQGDSLLDGWIFAAGSRAVDAVWVDGRQVVAGGRHVAREAVGARFAAVLRRLMVE